MASPALDEYQIGWICALPIEAAAAQEMLDESFGTLEEQDSADANIYTLGRIGKHYVVIACLGGQYGTTSATTVANNMMRTFSKSLRFGLMVGIGGGIPSAANDIRLGDIVISFPTGTCGGVLQHDMGKIVEDGTLIRTGSLNSPPRLLLAAVNKMRTAELTNDPAYLSYIDKVVQKNKRTRRNFSRPDPRDDRLFQIQYDHPSNAATCDGCLAEWEVERDKREEHVPLSHYGIIASGNAVIKHGGIRERLWKETGALCFEMEAAGLMLDFPCIVVRGICDYADSHKNKQWQGYAALAAASYTKELLGYVPRGQVSQEQLVTDICTTISRQLEDFSKRTDYISQKIDLHQLKVAKGAAFDSYENKHAECLPGTRSQLLRQIEEWAESPSGKCIFWLNGMAGTGKSTISQTLAARLKEKKSLGASFFFKRGEGDRGNAKRLFPTLIQQLVTSIPQLQPGILKAIEDDPYISEKALGEQFDKLFLQPLQSVGLKEIATMVIVIDALDECESKESQDDVRTILQLLPRVHMSKCVRVQFFLTSRPELPIRLGFKDIEKDHQNLDLHEIPKPEIEHDISMFLEHKLSEIQSTRSLPIKWPGKSHVQTLITMSVPLFIFAATICRILEDEEYNPVESLLEILAYQTDNSQLNGTYLPVLDRLLMHRDRTRKRRLAEEYRKVLGTIIMVETPLSVISLSILTGTPKDLINRRLKFLHSVLRIPTDETEPVRLFHLSFRDFLLDPDTRDKTLLWINEKEMHKFLTLQCLEIMDRSLTRNICRLSGDCVQRNEIDTNSFNHYLPPELQYACRYWAHHLLHSLDPVTELIKAFSFLEIHFLHWMEAMSVLGIISEVIGVIKRLQSIIQNNEHPKISDFLHDTMRFTLKNQQLADIAPLQVYSSGLMFTPRNSVIKGLHNGELSIWSQLPKVEESWSANIQTLEGHSNSVHSVAFSPDSRLLASGSSDNTIKLWDPSTGELRQTLEGHSSTVHSVAFSPDSRLLASGSYDNTIKLWDPSTGELRQTLEGHSSWVHSVAFSPDGRLLASGSYDNTIKLWDPSTGELRQTLEGHSHSVHSVAFSPDGRLLASGSDPDSRLLASGSDDNTIKLWDPSTGELRQTLEGHSGWTWPENSPEMSILEGKWLCLHSEKILWLAQEYRPTCLAVNGRVLALGHASGRVSFLSPCVL